MRVRITTTTRLWAVGDTPTLPDDEARVLIQQGAAVRDEPVATDQPVRLFKVDGRPEGGWPPDEDEPKADNPFRGRRRDARPQNRRG